MTRSVVWSWIGGLVTVVLMVLCLWGWQHASELSREAGQPYVAKWAVRSAAIAVGAVAQVVLLTSVIGRLYQRQLLDDVLRLSVGVVLAVSLVSALALAVAAR